MSSVEWRWVNTSSHRRGMMDSSGIMLWRSAWKLDDAVWWDCPAMQSNARQWICFGGKILEPVSKFFSCFMRLERRLSIVVAFLSGERLKQNEISLWLQNACYICDIPFGIVSEWDIFYSQQCSSSGGARDSMLPGHSQVNYLANQVKRKSRKLYQRATVCYSIIDSFNVPMCRVC